MNTLVVTHNGIKKKFQWKRNYNPQDFLSLLSSLFHTKERIVGLKDIRGLVFKRKNKKLFKGKSYEISYFLKHPNAALNHPYNLVLEGENVSFNSNLI